MTLADKITSSRLILAPLFFVFFNYFDSFWTVIVLWAIFIVSELSDLLDGMVARKRNEISDFGKLFDPFADTLTQLTYFLCFVMEGILHPFLLLAVLYREFAVLFVRNQMLSKGVTLAASMWGKVKTITYIMAGALALAASSVMRLGFPESELYAGLSLAAVIVFAVSVFLAIVSFLDYVRTLKKTGPIV